MSGKSTTEWLGYPSSTRVRRNSLLNTPAWNGESVGGGGGRLPRAEYKAYSGNDSI